MTPEEKAFEILKKMDVAVMDEMSRFPIGESPETTRLFISIMKKKISERPLADMTELAREAVREICSSQRVN